jgi:hypothetical protein
LHNVCHPVDTGVVTRHDGSVDANNDIYTSETGASLNEKDASAMT